MAGEITAYHTNELKPNSVSDEANERILYTQVWIALRRGGPQRASLPEELVVTITRLAGFKVRDVPRTIVCDESVSLICWDGELVSKIWFQSSPLSDADASHMAALQLVTESSDQGWGEKPQYGPWSWFDIGAHEDPESDRAAASGMVWKRSHHSRLTHGKNTAVEGPVMHFEEDDTVPMVYPGARVIVRASAQCLWWMNWGHKHKAELRFWRWFEPVQSIVQKRLITVGN